MIRQPIGASASSSWAPPPLGAASFLALDEGETDADAEEYQAASYSIQHIPNLIIPLRHSTSLPGIVVADADAEPTSPSISSASSALSIPFSLPETSTSSSSSLVPVCFRPDKPAIHAHSPFAPSRNMGRRSSPKAKSSTTRAQIAQRDRDPRLENTLLGASSTSTSTQSVYPSSEGQGEHYSSPMTLSTSEATIIPVGRDREEVSSRVASGGQSSSLSSAFSTASNNAPSTSSTSRNASTPHPIFPPGTRAGEKSRARRRPATAGGTSTSSRPIAANIIITARGSERQRANSVVRPPAPAFGAVSGVSKARPATANPSTRPSAPLAAEGEGSSTVGRGAGAGWRDTLKTDAAVGPASGSDQAREEALVEQVQDDVDVRSQQRRKILRNGGWPLTIPTNNTTPAAADAKSKVQSPVQSLGSPTLTRGNTGNGSTFVMMPPGQDVPSDQLLMPPPRFPPRPKASSLSQTRSLHSIPPSSPSPGHERISFLPSSEAEAGEVETNDNDGLLALASSDANVARRTSKSTSGLPLNPPYRPPPPPPVPSFSGSGTSLSESTKSYGEPEADRVLALRRKRKSSPPVGVGVAYALGVLGASGSGSPSASVTGFGGESGTLLGLPASASSGSSHETPRVHPYAATTATGGQSASPSGAAGEGGGEKPGVVKRAPSVAVSAVAYSKPPTRPAPSRTTTPNTTPPPSNGAPTVIAPASTQPRPTSAPVPAVKEKEKRPLKQRLARMFGVSSGSSTPLPFVPSSASASSSTQTLTQSNTARHPPPVNVASSELQLRMIASTPVPVPAQNLKGGVKDEKTFSRPMESTRRFFKPFSSSTPASTTATMEDIEDRAMTKSDPTPKGRPTLARGRSALATISTPTNPIHGVPPYPIPVLSAKSTTSVQVTPPQSSVVSSDKPTSPKAESFKQRTLATLPGPSGSAKSASTPPTDVYTFLRTTHRPSTAGAPRANTSARLSQRPRTSSVSRIDSLPL